MESQLGIRIERFLLWGILLSLFTRNKSLFALSHEETGDQICNMKCSNEFVVDSLLDNYNELSSRDKKTELKLVQKLCQASNAELQIDVKPMFKTVIFHRLLMGEGSHRQIVSSMNYRTQENATADLFQYLCELILVERLTPGLFADPFELQRLVKRGVFTDAVVFGDTNLELPSALSGQSVVEIHAKIDISHVNKGNEINLQVPLHARYPPLGESGFSAVEIGTPDMIIRCRHQLSLGSCLLLGLEHESGEDAIRWMIPAGKESHASFVWMVTAGSAFLSALVIVIASIHSLQMREKD